LRVTVGEIKAELGVVLAGADVFVRVHVDTWSDSQLHARSRQTRRVQRIDAIEFVEAVDHEVAHTSRDCLA
jgi:hypothetical protein